jgi:putative SOS response-associated peptidase YedK
MPVLLTTQAEYARWLNPEAAELGPLEELMRPMPDGMLQSYSAK